MHQARMIVAALLSALLMITFAQGSAVAAKPKANGSYGDCQTVDGMQSCPMRFNTNGHRNRIVDFSLYTKCATVPVVAFADLKIRVNDRGRFHLRDVFVDVLDRKVRFIVNGRFKRHGKVAVGSYDVDGRGDYDCHDRERNFRAKYLGEA